MSCFEILGLTLLALGFLYGVRPKIAPRLDFIAGFWLVGWSVFVLLVVFGVWGQKTFSVVAQTTTAARVLLVAGTLFLLLRSEKAAPQERRSASWTPSSSPRAIGWAFAAWLVGPLLGVATDSPAVGPAGRALSLLIFVGLIAREVVSEYEIMEASRHRLGRERQVVFSYLERIGGAFTRALQLDEVLGIILESALESTEAQAGAIYLLNTKTQRFEPRVVMNFFPPLHVDTLASQSPNRTQDLEREMKAQSFAPGEGIVGEVAAAGAGRLVQDVRAAGIMLGTTTEYMRNRSMLLVPLRVADASIGVMTVLNKQRGSFSPEDQSLLQSLADQSALSINNALLTQEVGRQERIRRELQIARDIQQRLLPKECPLVPGFSIGARGSSATEVGGDYYDFFWVDKDRLGIVVADVSGKGVHAALIVAMVKSAFRAVAQGNRDVKDVLSRVNDFTAQDLRSDMFVTCVYGILDVPRREFSWARAGHEPIIVTHPSQETDIFSPPGFALGVLEGAEFRDLLEVQTVALHTGDKLLLFTDGLTEAMNGEGEEFGMQRILQVMEHPETLDGASSNGAAVNTVAAGSGTATSVANGAPSSAQEPSELRDIERAVQNHVGDAPQSDDLTMVYLAAR